MRDTLAVAMGIGLPNIAKGAIIRRPWAVSMAQRLDLDRRAVRLMQRLRKTYGAGPLHLRLPGRSQALLLSPEHVQRVLRETPEPFATASFEKRRALAHFEPKNALISHGPKREERRSFNERALETERPAHSLADRFLLVIDDEIAKLAGGMRVGDELDWHAFFESWYRIVRRIVLGEDARDDHELTDILAKLRSNANWAFLRPQQARLRDRFHERLEAHLARAEAGSLAAIIARLPKTAETAPSHQVAQWLFAFDPGGMATFRALAVLAGDPEQERRARAEIADASAQQRKELPFLRGCILESLRLWPTTPLLLRETTRETEWETGVMPANTGIVIFAPFFHRDSESLDYADRFFPDLWSERDESWPLVPFSGGPAVCPAVNLVPMIAAATLAALLESGRWEAHSGPVLDPQQPLPGTLDNYSLKFRRGS